MFLNRGFYRMVQKTVVEEDKILLLKQEIEEMIQVKKPFEFQFNDDLSSAAFFEDLED